MSLRSLKTLDSFRNPVYRLYYAAMAGHWSSMSMQMVARSLLIYRITGSGAILGIMALGQAIPTILLSLLGGAIADRVQKKYVIIAGQVGSALVTLGIALALTLGYLGPDRPGSWWLLIVSAVLQGAIMGLMMPSRQAIIPEIISAEQVMNAISLNTMGMNVFRLLAPAVTGVLIDNFDFGVIYYFATGMYIMATVCVVFLPRTRTIKLHESSTIMDILEGFRYIRNKKTILLVIVFTLFGFILGQPFMYLMPMFTEDILNVGATGMGLLVAVSGLGAILGSLILATLPNRKRGVLLLLSGLIMSLALVGFSGSQWLYLSAVMVIFVGLGQTGQMTLGTTMIQNYVDADYRGRVMSFLMMGIGFASLGTFIAGVLAEVVGVQWSVGGLAVILALIVVAGLTLTPRLRKLD